MSMKKTPWRHHPGLRLLLVMCLSFILIKLGLWQWSRGNLRSHIKHQWEHRQQLSPVPLKAALNSQKDPQYVPITTRGTFLNHQTFLIDNQTYRHQPGYAVITPFKTQQTSKIILINRGWVSKNHQAIQPTHQTSIQGLIYQPYQKTFILNASRFLDNRSLPIVQNGNLDAIEKALSLKTEPYYIWLTTQPNPYHRIWDIKFPNPGINYGYALQYFIFALLILGAYIRYLFKHPLFSLKAEPKN